MSKIEWNESYSVNVPSIDEQHKKLFVILNKTQEMIQSGKSNVELKEIFSDTLNYAAEHFAYEEQLMSENGFENLESHKLEHEKFAETVASYLIRYESSDSIHPVEVLGFLIDWLQKHILKKDKEYSSCLSSKGIV